MWSIKQKCSSSFTTLLVSSWSIFQGEINGPLGKTQYYPICVEFQVRGSPHIHSFIWVLNAPKLSKLTKEEHAIWVDNIICADLPDPNKDTKLWNLVSVYQIHRHSKTCRKYCNEKYRFHFGKYFTSRTVIAEPFPNDTSDKLNVKVVEKRRKILRKVKGTKLNPSKGNLYDPARDDFKVVNSTEYTLILQQISTSECEAVLPISDDNDFQVNLKRPPNSCFVITNFWRENLHWKQI